MVIVMKPILVEKNFPHGFSSILEKFEASKPLSSDQLNFLSSHERALSNSTLDPVIRYYLTSHLRDPKKTLSLSFPNQKLNEVGFKHIKHNMHMLLKENLSHVDLKMTLEQFMHFKSVGINELIFWHGNQFLTGAPLFPGGIPYVIYFQWGNLFGVVKFQVLPEEKALKGNVLIYIEDMQERHLYECIKDYANQHKEELKHQNEILQNNRVQENIIKEPVYKSPTPRLGNVMYDPFKKE